jgi:lysophospholipase L1-like esterase
VQFKKNTVARDTFSAGTGFEAMYHFRIEEGVSYTLFRAVVEQPALWQVSVNGHALPPEKGQWWLDKNFAVYAAGAYMHTGDNTLELKARPMSVYAEIEPVYILGDFGLASVAKGWEIVAPVALHIGSWKQQGLPLYGQSISYIKEFRLDKIDRAFAVRLGKWKGTVAAVKVNGAFAGIIAFDPYTLDISSSLHPGKNRIEVIVVGSLKNLLGPHHNSPKPGLVSPWQWRYVSSYPPGRQYDTYDYGLMEDFEVVSEVSLPQVKRSVPAPLDTEGHLINAHGAGVMFYKGTYYLFGEIKKGRTWLVTGQEWEDYRVPAGGVSCYSSKDLKRWKYEGVALAPEKGQPLNDLDTGRVIERPKVIYNSVTRQFVMWMHVDKNDYSYSRAGVAVSERPAGPYRYLRSFRPNEQMARDLTVFKDEDGKAYLVYSSENNNTMQVCLLSRDYLSPTSTYRRILVDRRREAPAVFRTGGKYYLITSSCTGWSPNTASYAIADNPLGPWKETGSPCEGPDALTTFDSQSSFVLPVQGKPGRFIFMADRWNKLDLEASDYLWLPFIVKDGQFGIRKEEGTARVWTGEGSGRMDKARPSAATIGTGYGRVYRQAATAPFDIIETHVNVKCGSQEVKAFAFLRFYNTRNRLLLEYRTNAISSVEGIRTGHYTLSPPGTSYLRYGVERDPSGKGDVFVDSGAIDIKPGRPLARHPPQVSLDAYMKPFWNTDTIENETILMYAINGNAANGRLLYTPDKIISVRSFDGATVYRKDIDYTLQGNTLTRAAQSGMPFRADTSFDTKNDLAWFDLQSQWVVITYTHADKWDGPVPVCKERLLPHTLAKLRSKRPLSIVAYGMSITRGYNVSGYDGVAPYMPGYADLFAGRLREIYGYGNIRLYNAALPGSTVDWGARYAAQYINPVKPDLVILDFGMNDFWRLEPAQFAEYVKTIIRKVKEANPVTEFLLVSNMQFDPFYILPSDKYKAFYETNLAGYNTILQQMETTGIADLDMTTLSGFLYKRKKSKDCLANPLHPNDYLARWYAQEMVAMLVKTK